MPPTCTAKVASRSSLLQPAPAHIALQLFARSQLLCHDGCPQSWPWCPVWGQDPPCRLVPGASSHEEGGNLQTAADEEWAFKRCLLFRSVMWKEKSVHINFHLLKHSLQNASLKQTIKNTKFSHLERGKKTITSSFPIFLSEQWAYENAFIM